MLAKPSLFNNWFLKREISPVFTSFHINVAQDRICSGGWDTWDEFWYQMASYNMATITADLESLLAHNTIDSNHIITETNVNVVSQATYTLTGAASVNEKIIYASISNATRPPQVQITITPNGMTAVVIVLAVGVQTISNGIIGQAGNIGINSNGAMSQCPFLQPTDTAVLEDLAFVAADVVRHQFVSETYSM